MAGFSFDDSTSNGFVQLEGPDKLVEPAVLEVRDSLMTTHYLVERECAVTVRAIWMRWAEKQEFKGVIFPGWTEKSPRQPYEEAMMFDGQTNMTIKAHKPARKRRVTPARAACSKGKKRKGGKGK